MSATLSGKIRKQTGKKSTKQTRQEGLLPAVLYGQKDNLNISINPKELTKIINQKGLNAIIQLALEGDTAQDRKVLLKEYQRHPLKEDWVHVDFFEVNMNQTIKVHVPIRLTGVSPGVKQGGILNHVIQELSLECLPADIPEVLEVSVDKLELEEAVHVTDLNVSEKVTILHPATATVAIVHAEKKVEEKPVEGEEAAASPEEGGEAKPPTDPAGEGAKAEK